MKFAAVITLALLVVSCHHEKAASAETATAPDPCALIGTDDLRRITGFAAKEGETTGDEKSAHRCTWHEGGEAGAGVITIIDDGDAADVLVAHRARHVANALFRIDVKQRTSFDHFADLFHCESLPGAVFGFSARFPSPS